MQFADEHNSGSSCKIYSVFGCFQQDGLGRVFKLARMAVYMPPADEVTGTLLAVINVNVLPDFNSKRQLVKQVR
jgi:hypothetical protein